MLYQQYNCVLTINTQKDGEAASHLAPINISDLENDMLVPHTPPDLRFTQQHVPFDFDGDYLLYMEYLRNSERKVFLYSVAKQTITEVLRFTKADPIVSHVKLTRNSQNGIKLVYVQGGRQIKTYDVNEKKHMLVGVVADSILALHVRKNYLRQNDRAQPDGAEGAAA